MQLVRPSAVAGAFYPAQKDVLASDVGDMLNVARMEAEQMGNASDQQNTHPPAPKALIVPHAGYIYSGPTAAAAYIRLVAFSDRIKRVILLGPVHRVAVRGLALPGADVFVTPLGEITIDQNAIKAIENLPQVVESPAAHAEEHSLEVQLPFLQAVLGDFTLLPLAVGDATSQEVAQVLDAVWGGAETLIVISSDLSHFLPYETAQRVDAETVENILRLHSSLNHQQACGSTPVNGLMLVAKQHHLQPQLLDLRNSGDTAGDRNRVVGYAAFAFTGEQGHAKDQGRILLQIARASIAEALNIKSLENDEIDEQAGWLQQPGACFVTLTQGNQLRGCVGSLEAHRSLLDDVKNNARAAAFEDTRFSPLSRDEFDTTQLEVSLLTPMQPLDFASEQEALEQLRPGIDGVVFEYGYQRSTFLPQVWQQLPEQKDFMAQLKLKAGLPADFWAEGVKLSRYTVRKYKQRDFDELTQARSEILPGV